jgi:hypothetical protein
MSDDREDVEALAELIGRDWDKEWMKAARKKARLQAKKDAEYERWRAELIKCQAEEEDHRAKQAREHARVVALLEAKGVRLKISTWRDEGDADVGEVIVEIDGETIVLPLNEAFP